MSVKMARKEKDPSNRYIVIIWLFAGGRDDNKLYSVWSNDETGEAYVFGSFQEARDAWRKSVPKGNHTGTVLNITAEQRTWI